MSPHTFAELCFRNLASVSVKNPNKLIVSSLSFWGHCVLKLPMPLSEANFLGGSGFCPTAKASGMGSFERHQFSEVCPPKRKWTLQTKQPIALSVEPISKLCCG